MQTKPPEPNVTIDPTTVTHQTFNDCPDCGKTWETKPPIQGIIHRTILCIECSKKNNEKHFQNRPRR